MTLPSRDFIENLKSLLRDLDDAESGEEMEELNATLEDVIFLLEEIDPDDPDAGEEAADATVELNDLTASYARIPGMFPYAERLKGILAARE